MTLTTVTIYWLFSSCKETFDLKISSNTCDFFVDRAELLQNFRENFTKKKYNLSCEKMSKEQKDVIEHYKKKLVRNLEDSDKVLHCLKKLEAAPVTIEILTQTEVGKIVNRLKKNPDATKDVIKASKALVEKWKDLVKTTEENESKEV